MCTWFYSFISSKEHSTNLCLDFEVEAHISTYLLTGSFRTTRAVLIKMDINVYISVLFFQICKASLNTTLFSIFSDFKKSTIYFELALCVLIALLYIKAAQCSLELTHQPVSVFVLRISSQAVRGGDRKGPGLPGG